MTLKEFITNLEQEVKNHSIYVWGGGGQKAPTITEAWITAREKTSNDPARNAQRAIAFLKKQIALGYGAVLRAFDCSGLGTFCMGKSKTKANTMMGWCAKLSRGQLKRGDWVFRVDGAGKAYHIGYIVDDALNVIEAMGRDDGVVKRSLNASGPIYWNAYGRPKAFAAEIDPVAVIPTSPAQKKIYILGGSVNIRNKPDASGQIIKVAKKGETYALIAIAPGGWYEIEKAGQYISNKADLTKLV